MNDMKTMGALSRARAENRALNRIMQALFAGTDIDEVLPATAGQIAQAISADACFIYLLETDGNLTMKAATPPHGDSVGRVELALGQGIPGWVALHREPAVLDDGARSDPRYEEIAGLSRDDYRSQVVVPLVSPNMSLTGAIDVSSETRRHFTVEDVSFLEHVGSLVAAAIEHAKLFHNLEAKEQMLQRTIERTVSAQEEERRRVATEIHDGVTQHLISIFYRLNACERLLDRDSARARVELEAAKSLIDEALDEARVAIYDLRPSMLDDLGLGPALEALARTLGEDFDVSVATDLRGDVPSHLETALYRVAQEALNNIRKHAGPCRVTLSLETTPENELVLRVEDAGRGFDPDALERTGADTTFGLMGMGERVNLIRGRLSVQSRRNRGTSVEVRVPLDNPAAGGAGGS